LPSTLGLFFSTSPDAAPIDHLTTMPTTHVEPGCDPLLQEIANALWKSRKVVVVTGAGISTNSGIPVRPRRIFLPSLLSTFSFPADPCCCRTSDPRMACIP
jgi:hypothetical protein